MTYTPWTTRHHHRPRTISVGPDTPLYEDCSLQLRLFEEPGQALDRQLDEFVADWHVRGRAPRTASEYVRHINQFRRQHPVTSEWNVATARAYLLTLPTPNVARHAARALKAFDLWRSEEYGSRRLFDRLRLPAHTGAANAPVATEGELESMLRTRPGDSFRDVRDRALIHTFRSTGARLGEVSRMQWHDIDFRDGRVTLPSTKAGRSRVTRLDGRAQAAVAAYRAVGEQPGESAVWLLPQVRRPMREKDIYDAVMKMSRRAGVYVTPHAIRRRFAVSWLAAGGSGVYLEAVAGWSSEKMLRRYVTAVANSEAVLQHERLFG
jgi:integrase